MRLFQSFLAPIATSAALVAFIAWPAVAGTALLATGLGVLMHHDYRTRRALSLPVRSSARCARCSRAVFRAPALAAEPHRLAA